jgi:hypothetical protein
LYNEWEPKQIVYVDRSSHGKGKIGYSTGGAHYPEKSEAKGWSVVENCLTFDGFSLKACPSEKEGYGLSLDYGDKHMVGCISVVAKVIEEKPNSCFYSVE